jgi:hypothetical protein
MIWLHFQIFIGCMQARLACCNSEEQSDLQIGLNPRFHRGRTGMEQGPCLRRSLGDFEWNLRRHVQRG